MARLKKGIWGRVFAIISIIILVVGILGLFSLIQIIRGLPHPERITDLQPTQSTKIYDRTGQVLLYEIHGAENRTVLSSQEIPSVVKEAAVTAEDQSFYQHSAVDWRGVLRAFLVNLAKGTISQGGSTITQQLAKTVFLTPERTVTRKIKELFLAYWIEENYSKDEILTAYLNQIPFGSNAYGVQAAAQLYFGKDAKDLTTAEAATLASLIESPTYLSPWGKHLSELMSRKNYILDQMRALGFIDNKQFAEAKAQQLSFMSQSVGSIRAPHFVMMVRDYLINKYGEDVVENGGLKVITTLDWDKQQTAGKVVEDGAKRNKELYSGDNAAMVVEDPKTGQILSMVGSADYFDTSIDGNFNVATQGLRHPGSAFKPFVYTTAFKKGYTPDTVIFDVPTEFAANNPNCPVVVDYANTNKDCFHPQNFDEKFRGPVSFRQALSQSLNIPSVKVLYLAGIDNAITTAQSMGITTLNDPNQYGLALVLGGGAVKLSELVGAYSVFSRDGVKHDASFILNVQDSRGDALEKYADNATQVLEPQYARLINSILSDSGLRANLFQASLQLTVFDGYQVALKTGTTNDYRDAWSIGYTPFLTVGVWAGNTNYQPMQRKGGSILAAVPIWSAFMNQVINNYPHETFVPPEPVISTKPMLDGQYMIMATSSFPQIHDILYYIEKNHPEDPLPSNFNPANDPQFYNWEVPAISWATANIPNFAAQYNK